MIPTDVLDNSLVKYVEFKDAKLIQNSVIRFDAAKAA